MLPQDAGMPEQSGREPQPRRGSARSRKEAKARNALVEVQAAAARILPALPPGVTAGPDMNALLGAFKRRWPVALSLGLILAVGAAIGAWFLLAPKYTAFALIRVHGTKPFNLTRVDGADNRNEFLTYQKTQAAEIKSHAVLSLAFDHPDVVQLGIAKQHDDPIAWLEEELKVEFQENNEVMTVSLASNNAEEALALVRAVSEAYDRKIAKVEPLRMKRRLQEMQRILADKTKALVEKKEKKHQMADKLGTSSTGALTQKQLNLLKELGERQSMLTQAEREWSRLHTRIEQHKSREDFFKKPVLNELDVDAALQNDDQAKLVQAELSQHKKTLTKYEDRKTETVYLRAKSQIKGLEKTLGERRDAVKAELTKRLSAIAQINYDHVLLQLETEVRPLAQEREKLQAQVAELTKRADQVGISSTDFEILSDEIRNEQQFVDRLQTTIENLSAEENTPPRAELYQAAALQKQDIKRQVAATVAAPVAVLILVGLAVAWWEFRARRIQSSDEVSQGLGIRVVGAVPTMPNKQARGQALVLADQQALGHCLLESIDAIRTLLLQAASLEGTRVVMVTSAVAGEGKTTLASHLASSLARAGRRTLLIDCDLRGPTAHQLFELPLQPGLSEVLLEEIDPDHAIQPTTVEGLSLLSAGQWDREVMQALARDGVKVLFDKLREEYDFLIVDSHPVLPATDSLLVGQHADAVLLSILRDVSQAPRVYAACQKLSTLSIRILGAVVSGASPEELYAPSGAYAAPAAT